MSSKPIAARSELAGQILAACYRNKIQWMPGEFAKYIQDGDLEEIALLAYFAKFAGPDDLRAKVKLTQEKIRNENPAKK